MPQRYALIIANGTYQDPKLSRLRTPTRDAEELARVLGDPEIGDFEVELSMDEPEHALRRRIATFFGTRERDDLLLLHVSCHGLKDDSGQLYFAATDTEVAQLDATAISAEFLSRQMTRSRSRKVVALLDCCYSGAIARGLRFRAGETVQLDDHLGGHGRVILTASSAMEYAFEGDELTGSGSPSVFTSAVVKGLETGEADRDQDRRISIEELYDYVREQVRDVTPDQSPNMLSHLEGDIYIARSSYVAEVEPKELPSELHAAIESPFAGVREGAVSELARLASGSEAGLAAAARAALRGLADDDSRRVAAAAAQALDEGEAVAAGEPVAAAREPLAAPPEPVAPSPATPAAAAVRRPLAPAQTPSPPVPGAGPRRAAVIAGAVQAAAPTLAMLGALFGALLVVLSHTALADSPWPDPVRDLSLATTVTALLAAALVILRQFRGRVWLVVAAVALAGVPLGVSLAIHQIEVGGSDLLVPATPALIGSLMLMGAALWQARVSGPGARSITPVDGLLLAAGLGLAVATRQFLPQHTRPEGLLLVALAIAVVAALTAGLCGPLPGRAHTVARLMSVVAPAGGVVGMAAVATYAAWLSRTQGSSAQLTQSAVFWASLALTVAALASLLMRIRSVTDTAQPAHSR